MDDPAAKKTPSARARLAHGFFKTAGACLGVFAILNALGDPFIERFGAEFLWIRFPEALAVPGRIVLLGAAVVMLLAAFRPIRSRRAMIAGRALLWTVAAAALWNALGFWGLLLSGRIRSWLPIPSSLVILAILLANAWRIRREHVLGARIDAADGPLRLAAVHGVSFVAVALFGPLFLLFAYGATDYSPMAREAGAPADCIIVYGARVYADGRPSLSLRDRVSEGVRLWRAGKGRFLVMSGATGEGSVSEPEAMRELAVGAGVPAAAVVLDETGANTYCSAVGAARLMREREWRKSLSVSHYYHLLRIQLSARRAGVVTYTVPARMTRRLAREPWFVLRECAAFYGYYFFRWGGASCGQGSRSAAPVRMSAERPPPGCRLPAGVRELTEGVGQRAGVPSKQFLHLAQRL